MISKYLDLHPGIQAALTNGEPVVALESTIISHGMPYPRNMETALKLEETIRQNGAVPATIAIIKGRLKAGLSESELEHLARADGIRKVSRRDIPTVVSRKLDGATTVASTMIIAELAGIRVFVTGGIGGVHRGASTTFDISADLTELAKTNVAVLCAGIKSILDIGSTLEYLETQGVPVFGYRTDEFPAFYTRTSGFPVDQRYDELTDLAEAIRTKWDLNLQGGIVIGNPVPTEHEMEKAEIDRAIEQALKEAVQKEIRGKEITPFLLARIVELTGERSLATNIELVLNNAAVGAQLAVRLADLAT